MCGLLELSDQSKGHSRERVVEGLLCAIGYRTVLAAKSGQRRGSRADEGAFPCDVVGLPPAGLPYILAEVGGIKKSAKTALAEMVDKGLPAGAIAVVVRQVKSRPIRKWRWHTVSATFDSVEELVRSVE